MTREYYIVKKVNSDTSKHKTVWELSKYNEKQQFKGIGMVVELYNGSFESDDIGFQNHRNEKASRRIRIVKEHIRQGEPKATCYWIEGSKVDSFTA
jgi:hypothetical protein